MKRNRQTGMVGVEIALLVVVVAVFGFFYYRTYVAKTKVAPTTVSKVSNNTAADGNVDHAVNAITNDVGRESASSQSGSDAGQITNTANAAGNVEGSFNENDF